MQVYLRDGSAQTILRAETKLSVSPSHSILTLGQPAPALTLYHQGSGRIASGVPILKSLVRLDPAKSWRKQDSNPGSAALEADALTTRPTRRSAEVVAAAAVAVVVSVCLSLYLTNLSIGLSVPVCVYVRMHLFVSLSLTLSLSVCPSFCVSHTRAFRERERERKRERESR